MSDTHDRHTTREAIMELMQREFIAKTPYNADDERSSR